jgi:plasmid maintenance system antidote protein VapI
MEKLVEKYRGISPGAVLERELKRKKVRQNTFAGTIGIPAQTLNAIIKGKRKMTPEVALKIDYALGLEESTMGILQAYYETRLIRQKPGFLPHPDLAKLRRILFWDTDFDKIDWQHQQNAIIQRVFERGNEEEKNEIIKFYGAGKVNVVIAKNRKSVSR